MGTPSVKGLALDQLASRHVGHELTLRALHNAGGRTESGVPLLHRDTLRGSLVEGFKLGSHLNSFPHLVIPNHTTFRGRSQEV